MVAICEHYVFERGVVLRAAASEVATAAALVVEWEEGKEVAWVVEWEEGKEAAWVVEWEGGMEAAWVVAWVVETEVALAAGREVACAAEAQEMGWVAA
ncbi:hypothetical protein AB1Y20_016882 [Prymnesium parvum]|uniref:Uncharacterized protein n=1 Tax=Prymnesium parvum TaxID=97485 RepID=A0AB34ICD9_PRYPA